jgi:hypothetical protein
MKIIDDGHIYSLRQLGTDEETKIKFVKRSGGAVQYEEEWAGLQTQEVIRALIFRTQYLNNIISCNESEAAIWHLRMALFEYEARAYRRKQEELNRKQPQHDDTQRPKPWHENDFDDVPFNEHEIELRPIGNDGHIIL